MIGTQDRTPTSWQPGGSALSGHISANQEVLRSYQQALALTKGKEAYYSILAQRAKVYLDLYQGKEAAGDYEPLLHRAKQAGNPEQELEFLLGLARAYYLVALDDQETSAALKFRDLCATAQTLAYELGNQRHRIASLLLVTGLVDFWPEYREQASDKAKQALALSCEFGDEELVIESKLAIFISANVQNQAELGEVLLHEYQTRRDLTKLNRVYFDLMWAHYLLGNFMLAVMYCDAGIELAGRIGVPPVMYPTLKAFALLGLGHYAAVWEALQEEIADNTHPFGRTFRDAGIGMYLFELTAYTQAAVVFEQVTVQAERLRRGWLQRWARLMCARSLLRAGHIDRADWARVAKRVADTGDDASKGLKPLLAVELQAEMALAEGRQNEALPQMTKAITTLRAIGYKSDLVSALELQARVILQLHRPAEALTLAEEAFHIATEIDSLPMVWRVRATKAKAMEQLGQGEAATQEWHIAAMIIQGLADTITDGELQQQFMSEPLVASIIIRAGNQYPSEEGK